uniref:Bromodomain and PHD finger-containing protein n=2 Tax=Timema TaxID=61471 RepID=A0A7R9EYI5_9NEOP|nr:unnamed protein product [Timema bartmani]
MKKENFLFQALCNSLFCAYGTQKAKVMRPDFDVAEFCRNLRATKSSNFKCPIEECGRVYKSLSGLHYHLLKIDHNAPTPASSPFTPRRVSKKGRRSHHSRSSVAATSNFLSPPPLPGLTYAEAQEMVEFHLDGTTVRVNIHDSLEVCSKDDCIDSSSDTMKETKPTMEQASTLEDTKVSLPEPHFTILDSYNISDAPPMPKSYIRFIERSTEELDAEVEYDMDEEDSAWLELINVRRANVGLTDVPVDIFELLMDRLEKESYFQTQICAKTEDIGAGVIDDEAVCCICMDGECQNSNVILFCDMCNLAVHQDCYGVPYIPEGQWMCRRCLQSPSRAVDCVLCPNNDGAFKQTDRGHWAHVVCALWIPEVRFANTVFLEPIDSIEKIPPARWKLTCYICKQRGVGACIQCQKSHCYAAFHVTCAQQAGLYMKMDTVTDTNIGAAMEPRPMTVQKTAYCNSHTPANIESQTQSLPAGKKQKTLVPTANIQSPEESREKMKKVRRILAKKRSSVPTLSIPTIPPDRIQEIAKLVSIPKKNQFIPRLIAYWTLKRQSRNGVPLLRRLQSSHLSRRDVPRPQEDVTEQYRQFRYLKRLRQDLEKTRLLCELVRKREKLKNELCKVTEKATEFKLAPLVSFLGHLWEFIQAKDVKEIFSEPVDQTEVLDYSLVVKQPMDLSTMKTKLENLEYKSVDAFEEDFTLMISNCMAYNSKDTMFYKGAVKMRDQCSSIFRQARYDFKAARFDLEGGVFITEVLASSLVQLPNEPILSVHKLMEDANKEFLDALKAGSGVSNAERAARLNTLLKRINAMDPSEKLKKLKKSIENEILKVNNRIVVESAMTRRKGKGEKEHSNQHGEETEHEIPTEKIKNTQSTKLLAVTQNLDLSLSNDNSSQEETLEEIKKKLLAMTQEHPSDPNHTIEKADNETTNEEVKNKARSRKSLAATLLKRLDISPPNEKIKHEETANQEPKKNPQRKKPLNMALQNNLERSIKGEVQEELDIDEQKRNPQRKKPQVLATQNHLESPSNKMEGHEESVIGEQKRNTQRNKPLAATSHHHSESPSNKVQEREETTEEELKKKRRPRKPLIVAPRQHFTRRSVDLSSAAPINTGSPQNIEIPPKVDTSSKVRGTKSRTPCKVETPITRKGEDKVVILSESKMATKSEALNKEREGIKAEVGSKGKVTDTVKTSRKESALDKEDDICKVGTRSKREASSRPKLVDKVQANGKKKETSKLQSEVEEDDAAAMLCKSGDVSRLESLDKTETTDQEVVQRNIEVGDKDDNLKKTEDPIESDTGISVAATSTEEVLNSVVVSNKPDSSSKSEESSKGDESAKRVVNKRKSKKPSKLKTVGPGIGQPNSILVIPVPHGNPKPADRRD